MKNSYVVLIPAEGEIRAVPVSRDNLLEDLQKLVGGYIETVRPRNMQHSVLVIDEEGKLKDKPVNYRASDFYSNSYNHIVGDAVLIHTNNENLIPYSLYIAEDFADKLNRFLYPEGVTPK